MGAARARTGMHLACTVIHAHLACTGALWHALSCPDGYHHVSWRATAPNSSPPITRPHILCLPASQALLLTEHLLKNSSQHVVQTIIDAMGVIEGLKQFK